MLSPQTITDHSVRQSTISQLPEDFHGAVVNPTLRGSLSFAFQGRPIGLELEYRGETVFAYSSPSGFYELVQLRNGVIDVSETQDVYYILPIHMNQEEAEYFLGNVSLDRLFAGVSFSETVLPHYMKALQSRTFVVAPTNIMKESEAESLRMITDDEPSHMLTHDDLFHSFSGQTVDNTVNLLNDLSTSCELEPVSTIPSPPSWRESLKDVVFKQLEGYPEEYHIRAAKELEIIEGQNFDNIFKVVSDYVNFARISDFEVGAGRGSVSNSIVSFALGITEIDPIEHNLLFERFLNPERVSEPDIDIDFESASIEAMHEYLRHMYGKNNVALLRTYGTFGSKAVIRHVGKELGIEKYQMDFASSRVRSGETLKEATDRDPVLRKFFLRHIDYANHCAVLEGVRQSVNAHPAGVLINEEDLRYLLPLGEKRKDMWVCELEEKEVSRLGFLKFDILALTTLDFLKGMRIESGVDLADIPFTHKEVYDLFANGDTLGIFQFESDGMQETLRKIMPTSISELAIVNALYRPGPMQYIDQYVFNRDRGWGYHEDIDRILEETNGIIVFQEQYIEILSLLKGVSFGEGDNLRRFLAKGSEQEVKLFFRELYEESKELGIVNMNRFFTMMYHMKDYSFPKGHALSYSILSYRMAYFKAIHPELFTKHFLNYKPNKKEEIVEYAKSRGVEIFGPSYNNPPYDHSLEGRLILSSKHIQGVNHSTLEALNEKRKDEVWSFERMILEHCMVFRLKEMETLIFSGYFDDEVRTNRRAILELAEYYLNLVEERSFTGEEFEYFGLRGINPSTQDFSKDVLIEKEYEAIGCYREEKLVDFLSKGVDHFKIEELKPNAMNVPLFGEITRLRIIKTKKGDDMVFLDLDDGTGVIDVVVFPRTLERFRNELSRGYFVRIIGNTSLRDNRLQLIANEIKKK